MEEVCDKEEGKTQESTTDVYTHLVAVGVEAPVATQQPPQAVATTRDSSSSKHQQKCNIMVYIFTIHSGPVNDMLEKGLVPRSHLVTKPYDGSRNASI